MIGTQQTVLMESLPDDWLEECDSFFAMMAAGDFEVVTDRTSPDYLFGPSDDAIAALQAYFGIAPPNNDALLRGPYENIVDSDMITDSPTSSTSDIDGYSIPPVKPCPWKLPSDRVVRCSLPHEYDPTTGLIPHEGAAICSEIFTTADALVDHMAKVHKIKHGKNKSDGIRWHCRWDFFTSEEFVCKRSYSCTGGLLRHVMEGHAGCPRPSKNG